MKSIALIPLAMTALVAFAASDPDRNPLALPAPAAEPTDTGVFRLPQPAPVEPKFRKIPVAVPVPEPSPLARELVLAPLPALPTAGHVARNTTPPSPDSPATGANNSKSQAAQEAPEELTSLWRKRIGQWTEADARKALGAPLRSRSAMDERKHANGTIHAFADPTSRYRQLELDFDSKTGTLRTVFAYPRQLTWQQARRIWRGEVSAAEAPAGRKFYSYSNRRMDVLVDPAGKVISLGLY